MLKRCFLLLIGTMSMWSIVKAQNKPIVLFPKGAPSETKSLIEKGETDGGKVGGEAVLRITDVSSPTITIYQAPDDVASGAAMLVCPGGGYEILAYDLEGTEVCEWLNEIGITAILLKYRVPRRKGREKHEAPLQDVQRAIGYIRAHANELNIDPARIGVMGFSAGAHLAVMASNNYETRTYPLMDEADKITSRPDFCLLVYPAYLSGENFQLSPEIKVTSHTPPTMLIQAEDDKPHINSSLYYYYALKEAGVPAWMHLYSKGGHGYGLRDTGTAVNEWPYRVEDWLNEIGVIELPASE
ncbi:alpha/beta hydrolase [Parabacteroides pacaensis]|uniref:alpha/beta hydrolase n=1 Tax=Parabacteroides pacaensis TaxID=2086575 RepID=UPI000D0ECFC7|nr:alpha/beta hydrolase [Parabacteroides pacaensis]